MNGGFIKITSFRLARVTAYNLLNLIIMGEYKMKPIVLFFNDHGYLDCTDDETNIAIHGYRQRQKILNPGVPHKVFEMMLCMDIFKIIEEDTGEDFSNERQELLRSYNNSIF